MLRYFAIYKPYQVMPQFSPSGNKKTLMDFFAVPRDVYPVGRLDYDSEGLLVLSNDKSLNHRLLLPRNAHEREYLAEVEGEITEEALQNLRNGVSINISGSTWVTRPARASRYPGIPAIPERNPPVRFRKNIPTSWVQLILTEGKNRQVRKMTAAVGFPTLRLVRIRIGRLELGALKPGEMKEYPRQAMYDLLFSESI